MPFMDVSSSLTASTPITYPVVASNLDAELATTAGWVIELGDFNVRNSISTPVAHGDLD